MMSPPTSGSGVIGLAGRLEAGDTGAGPASLMLDGVTLPAVGTARLYVCGITPYDVTHLGHASTFVWADTLATVFGLTGVTATTCRNITDVDDVLTRAADARGRYYDEFALTQEFLFNQHMNRLRVKRPDAEPRARHHIAAVQQLAHALLGAGRAYVREGHVFFRGSDLFGRCGLDRDEALTLAREYGDDPADPRKDDPFDVPVWRSSAEQDPAWPSPWGWGRPGWHAECAAMALAVFGSSVDVLVGGSDLAFPHHAYQSAMVEAAVGVSPFARQTMHIGAVHRDGRKMAKSTGNLTLVDQLLSEHPAAAVRLLVLDRPWDRAWEFHPEAAHHATARLDRLYSAAGRAAESEVAVQEVANRLLDNVDVPGALEVAESAGGQAARWLIATLRLA